LPIWFAEFAVGPLLNVFDRQNLRTIDGVTTRFKTSTQFMARYSAFLSLQVEVQYRAGDILLPASGTFVGDTGRSIFLEQNFEQRGQKRHFRWEIPYQYIVRIAEKAEPASAVVEQSPAAPKASAAEPERELDVPEEENVETESAASAAAGFGSNVSLIFPRPQRSNI
jgi:hypothetical protein